MEEVSCFLFCYVFRGSLSSLAIILLVRDVEEREGRGEFVPCAVMLIVVPILA